MFLLLGAQGQCPEHQPSAVLPHPPQDLLSSPSLSSPVSETLVLSPLGRASIRARFSSMAYQTSKSVGAESPGYELKEASIP